MNHLRPSTTIYIHHRTIATLYRQSDEYPIKLFVCRVTHAHTHKEPAHLSAALRNERLQKRRTSTRGLLRKYRSRRQRDILIDIILPPCVCVCVCARDAFGNDRERVRARDRDGYKSERLNRSRYH